MTIDPSARLSDAGISRLVAEAGGKDRLRQHFNLHASFAEPCQRFLNAMCADSYIEPHRHGEHAGVETIVALTGTFACILFNDDGTPSNISVFGSGDWHRRVGLAYGVEVRPGVWHTIVMLSDTGVMLELKAGPFEPSAAKSIAPFAPAARSDEAGTYLANLKLMIADYYPRLAEMLSRVPETI